MSQIHWRDVLPGDEIRAADALVYVVESASSNRFVASVEMSHGERRVSGHPRPDSTVALLNHTDTRAAFETLSAAGLSPEVIPEGAMTQ